MKPLLLSLHAVDEEVTVLRGEVRAFLAVGTAGAKALGLEFVWHV